MIINLAGMVQDAIQQAANETAWTHFGIAAVPALMVTAMWIDARRAREEERRRTDERHLENIKAITALQTMIAPISNWWNNGRNNRS